MGKTVGRLLFSIRLLLTGHFPPFQVHGIDQWVVIEASANQMANRLPVCCVCGHIQVNPYRLQGVIGASEAICCLVRLLELRLSPFKVYQLCIMVLQMYCESIGRFYNAQILLCYDFSCWPYTNRCVVWVGDNCRLLHISAHKGPFGSIQSMMIMAHCGASCITQVSGFY